MILTVLLVSVTMPAFAATTIYKLSDYLIARTPSGNDIHYAFQFKTSPAFVLYDGTELVQIGAFNGKWFDVAETNGIIDPNFKIYPLGNNTVGTSGLNTGIEIKDFVGGATVSFTTSFAMYFKFAYNQVGSGSTNIDYTHYYQLYFYDKDGKYITNLNPSTSGGSITVPEVPADEHGFSSELWPFTTELSIKIPDGAAYLTPVITFSFDNNNNGMNAMVIGCQPVYNNFTIKVKENMLLKQSETMKSIEAELEETNDHLGNIEGELSDANTALSGIYDQNETIINGTDEQRQEAQDKQDQMSGTAQDIDETLSDLEKLEDYDTSSAIGTIVSFLSDPGWRSLKYLLSPILEWEHTATIMLVVVAFSTVSVLFFGR